jgi:RNAse (barnase) inhibitor barstar
MESKDSAKQAFVQKLEKHLLIAEEEIRDVKALYKAESGETKAQLYEDIRELEQKKWITRERLDQLKHTRAEAWRDVRPKVEDAWGEMLTAAQRAAEKLKEKDHT